MDPFNLLTLPCTKNKNKIKRKTGLYEWYKFPPTKMWKILKSISNVILPVELATVGICRCFLLCSCNYSHTAYMDCILSFYLKCFNHVFFCLVVEPLSMKAGLLGLWEWRTRWSIHLVSNFPLNSTNSKSLGLDIRQHCVCSLSFIHPFMWGMEAFCHRRVSKVF